MIWRFEDAGVAYNYTISENGACITDYDGQRTELKVPQYLDGHKVCAVGKKAFFDSRKLRRIYLPSDFDAIGDWAFAHCPDLEEIYIPIGSYNLGKALFVGCDNLKRICLTDAEGIKEADIRGFGSLLAAVCGILDAPFLFQTTGINEPEWLALWDARMLTILREDDMEGYTKLLLCGEEDYGSKENDLVFFLRQKRKRKVRLAYLRLLYDNGLAADNKSELEEYLLSHTKGCETEEAWEVLKDEHSEDMDYLRLFTGLSCLTQDNFDAALADLADGYPQMKAFLMRYKEEQMGREDFFAGLSLD